MSDGRPLDKSSSDSPQSGPASSGLGDLLKQKAALEEQIKDQYYREKSFMAIDVQKSTDIKKGKSKDAIFLTFDAYHQMVKNSAESHSGLVHETAGDGIMCVFDSADDACRAGISIVDAMPEFNNSQNRLGKPVVLRMGVNTGRVLIDEGRSIGELFDGVIDTAGHLQKEGLGGDLIITQATYDALADKSLFVMDKFWESKQIQLYKYGTESDASKSGSGAGEEFKELQKFTPVVDVAGGHSPRDLRLGELIWVKRPTGIYAEGKITMSQTDADYCRLVVELPDGTPATARIRTDIRLCVNFERAESHAQKSSLSPDFMRYADGGLAVSQVGNPHAAGRNSSLGIPSYVIWGGLALVALLAILVVLLLKL